MSKRDRARLATALDGLPPQIAHLRRPILDIARQDQDLLGCGEADTTLLESAVWEGDAGKEFDCEAAANALHLWLEGQVEHRSAWAAPVAFVEGFLRGLQMFGEGNPPPPRPKLAMGLQRIAMDVPAKMKTKLYAEGVAYSNREVQIIIGELSDDGYRIRLEGYTQTFQLKKWPRPPHLRDEIDANFKIGLASGVRFTSRHVETGLVVMSQYLLVVGVVKVEVGLFSRNLVGSDLSKYEAMIGSLRCK